MEILDLSSNILIVGQALKNENGVIQYDDLKKARLLNINFSSNFTANNNILPGNGVLNKDYGNKLSSVCSTPENVNKIINKLKSNGSPGPDKFFGLLLKNVVNEISYPLSCIFNISMSTSGIPAI